MSSITFSEKCILYFSAPWCTPCRTFYPRFKRLVEQLDGVELIKVNIDIEDNRDLGLFYQVRSIPAIVFLVNGQSQGMKIGIQNEDDILDFMRSIYDSADQTTTE